MTVEFSLTASLFFLLIMASFEFTSAWSSHAKRSIKLLTVCRIAIVPGNSADTAKTAASDFLSRAGINRSTVTTTPAGHRLIDQSVLVTVQADFSQNSWLTPVFARSLILRSDVTPDHENLSAFCRIRRADAPYMAA
ncbi:MAG: hypothetical protein U0892_16240 [Pirellulales bacterium]